MTEDNLFIPVSIVNKETQKGRNIRKDNYNTIFEGEINRVMDEFLDNNFEIEHIQGLAEFQKIRLL